MLLVRAFALRAFPVVGSSGPVCSSRSLRNGPEKMHCQIVNEDEEDSTKEEDS